MHANRGGCAAGQRGRRGGGDRDGFRAVEQSIVDDRDRQRDRGLPGRNGQAGRHRGPAGIAGGKIDDQIGVQGRRNVECAVDRAFALGGVAGERFRQGHRDHVENIACADMSGCRRQPACTCRSRSAARYVAAPNAIDERGGRGRDGHGGGVAHLGFNIHRPPIVALAVVGNASRAA